MSAYPYLSRDRFNLLMAIAHVGNDYHSGQWSRGYRLMCRATRRLQKAGLMRPLDCKLNAEQSPLYELISTKYYFSL